MKNDVLRIAIISPLFESVPPKFYGGTERVVSWLTEELVALGHDVTLFASGDSVTNARLRAPVPRALRLEGCRDEVAPHLAMLDDVFESADEFDVIHFNMDHWHLLVCKHLRLPGVTTLHGRLDNPEIVPLYKRVRESPLVSISDAQRQPLPFVNWVGTVYHGLPRDLLPCTERQGSYLAFLGRISPEKGTDRAIRIARRAGIPLKIAAKVDKADQAYYEERIRPLLQEPGVEFVGEIGENEKARFLGGALALLFPIDWPEPFGIVMIEAMACGTPIIAYRCGSVPEVMRDGETGFIVDDEDAAVAALHKLDQIERAACRRAFEERYTARRMALDYLRVYRRVCQPAMLRAAASEAANEAADEIALYPLRLTPAEGATMAKPLAKPAY